MSASQRRKGITGEQEVAHILSTALGLNVRRNWTEQFFGGAYDLVGVPGWAIEVKRAKRESIRDWWQQAVTQAKQVQLKPALIYRIDGQGRGLPEDEKWHVVAPLSMLHNVDFIMDHTVTMTLKTWIFLLTQANSCV